MSASNPQLRSPAPDQHGASRGEQFVWPPRPSSAATIATPPSPATSDAAQPSLPAVSPPRAAACTDSPVVPPAAAATPSWLRRFAIALRQMIHDAERTWLDVQCPVLRERLRDLGWRPNAPADYCGRCAQTLPAAEQPGGTCTQCEGKRLPWRRIVRLGPYRPPLTRLVHEVKFTRWRRLGADLGDLLGESLAAAIAEERVKRPDFPARVIVIPVPTTFRRRMYRGVDHTAILARGVARRLNARFMTDVLRRTHRPSQLAVLPSERTANIGKSIRRRRKGGADLRGALVIVVDDVTTTGATLRAACRGVAAAHRAFVGERGGGVEIWGAVVAATEIESPKSGKKRRDQTAGEQKGERGANK